MLGSNFCQQDGLMGDPSGGIVLEVSAYMTRNVTTLRNDSHLLDAALMIRRTGKRQRSGTKVEVLEVILSI